MAEPIRYIDLNDAELASLGDDALEALVAIELMHEGVVPAERPSILDGPDDPLKLLDGETWYTVAGTGMYFRDRESAEAFANLEPHKAKSDHRVSWRDNNKYPEPVDPQIETESLVPRADYDRCLDELVDRGKRKEELERARERYDKNRDRVRKVRDRVINAHLDAAHRLHEARAIGKTYDEYEGMTGGDDVLAMRFLLRAHDLESLRDALKILAADEESPTFGENQLELLDHAAAAAARDAEGGVAVAEADDELDDDESM